MNRFRLKYHPEDSVRRKEEQAAALKKRVEVFLDLLNSGKVNKVSVDCSKTNELLKLLDTVVIKLEGGAEEDIALLEQEYSEMEERSKEQKPKDDVIVVDKTKEENVNTKKEEGEIEHEKSTAEDGEVEQKTNGDIEENKNTDETPESKNEITESNNEATEEKMETEIEDEEDKKSEKKDIEDEPNLNEDKNNEDNEDVEDEQMPTDETIKDPNEVDEEADENKITEDTNIKKGVEKKRKRAYSGSSSSSSSSSDTEEEVEKKEGDEEKVVEEKEDKEEKEIIEDDKDKIETIDDDKPEKPKSLHKTTSIFLRNLAPTITKQEVEAMCVRYDGFLRVALADPQPERRWLRRGWVTFKRDANIKEICWNLNNIRLRECELGAIVNRDLSRRIRPVNGITAHKQVVRSDIRISARVTLHLDTKAGLWPDDEKKEKPQQTFGLVSNNPVLHNITDYLIEEASAEEEELLGLEPTADTQDSISVVERDDTLISVLDRIILYLRVVHSVDYYNHCEYPNEDEMPNRCGILHARGPAPTTKTDMTQFIGPPVEAKMANFLPEKPRDENNKNETKLIGLSLKDVDTEIDKFVQANTRELAKDKWLCPLSGKKFKGPDYVRKHIFNKHGEKIEEVKKEVEFFNNYLKDPKRPMLAEAPQPKREEPQTYNHPSYGGSYGGGGGGYGRPPPYYNQGFQQRSRGFPPRARNTPGDFRPVIHYRDLDAPREPEEFI